ncbi:MAG: ABC transporter substrate-binding protein [Acidobacteria bacterium]|jgi:peptide/nickel transport system substrate-binding protein|nr:ABC transporter substrate-binding protein [Acidobacteriota bacterium]
MNIVARLLILLLAGTAFAADNSIIYLRPADALNLNPWQAEDLYSTEIAVNVFEGLVRFKKGTTGVEPCLATAWSIHDGGKRWRFILRRGVRFHDGSAFDSRAVLHMFQSRLQKKQRIYQRLSSLFSCITAVRSLDAYGVEISLDRPYAPFLVALADSAASIQPPRPAPAGEFRPVGTGPFRFASWSKGRSLILGRNPDYWGGTVRLEKIIFKVMPDPLGRLLQIRNHSADMAAVQSGKEYEELSRRSDIAILSNPSISTHYLGFNTRRAPFDRKEVRAAFLHIMHKGNMVKQIFQNLAEPAFTPLPRPLFPKMKVQPVNSFNLDVARSLLKMAGLADGFSCSLYFAEGQQGIQEIADLLAIMARKVNILIRKVRLPFPQLVNAANRGEHDILLMGWTTGPDPDFFLYPLFTFSPGNRNRFFYENPELTRLLDEGKSMMDAGQRERIYMQALAVLKKDVPWIPLFHLIDNLACNRRVRGISFTPLGQVVFREVSKESTT